MVVPTRAALYCRVSTDEQVEEGRSAGTDDARKRTEFQRLLATAERRECDVVVV